MMLKTRFRQLIRISAFVAVLPVQVHAQALGSYEVDANGISVSGVSSGAYLAQQFHVAYSSVVSGAAIIAGGPYYCAGPGFPKNVWHALTRCMHATGPYPFQGAPDLAPSLEATEEAVRRGRIDAPQHLREDRVYLFSGRLDEYVPQPVMDVLADYYSEFVAPENILYVNQFDAGHGMVTDSLEHVACGVSAAPWLNNCDYDAAGALLEHLYGELQPPVAARPESMLSFAQGEFVTDQDGHNLDPGSVSLHQRGHLYLPKRCAEGARCRLHVAFHGCLMSEDEIGDAFYRGAGYNEWAESNDIIVLYPQIARSFVSPVNPMACWDWWGYTGPDFHEQNAPQLRAVWAMIQQVGALRRT